jgi:cytochrome bd-type quinol oxidase subunit 2
MIVIALLAIGLYIKYRNQPTFTISREWRFAIAILSIIGSWGALHAMKNIPKHLNDNLPQVGFAVVAVAYMFGGLWLLTTDEQKTEDWLKMMIAGMIITAAAISFGGVKILYPMWLKRKDEKHHPENENSSWFKRQMSTFRKPTTSN